MLKWDLRVNECSAARFRGVQENKNTENLRKSFDDAISEKAANDVGTIQVKILVDCYLAHFSFKHLLPRLRKIDV
jgi:hypothetical protein